MKQQTDKSLGGRGGGTHSKKFLHGFARTGKPAQSKSGGQLSSLAPPPLAAPLRVYMLRIYSAVILVRAVNSLKMKQMLDFFVCFAVVERLRAELISIKYFRPFYAFRIRLRIRNSEFEKTIRNYSRTDIPSGAI